MRACKSYRPFYCVPNFLALALAADARWLVSGDEDLLTLQHWQGVRIVDAAQFVREINTLMRDGPFFT